MPSAGNANPPDSFPGPHPDPPDDLPQRGLPLVHAAGPWFRIHRMDNDPVHFGRSGRNRFDAPGGEFGVLYAALDEHGSFIESFGLDRLGSHGVVTVQALADRGLARIHAARPLGLVDLTGAGLARIGADARLCAGDHWVARAWARALWTHPRAPDGLLYPARHDPSRGCVALFDRARDAVAAERLGSLVDPRQRQLLAAILDVYGYGLIA
ncbi:MAG TPA: RES family NAD+ phosphorylase [Thermomicrobiaceae bacterium]|nr:RES family NAD+ phosphorylase [Thermomicrobiaceae bacterium]